MNAKPEKRVEEDEYLADIMRRDPDGPSAEGVERTPGLWRTVRNNGISTEVWELLGHSTMRIVFGNDLDVAYCPPVDGDDGNANAAFIVRACNAHNRLVEALKRAEHDLGSGLLCDVNYCPHTECTLAVVRTALALANVDPDDPMEESR